ncbi:MAG: hypothetical protein ABL951_16250 [Alphaproteobacteria bacterium]
MKISAEKYEAMKESPHFYHGAFDLLFGPSVEFTEELCLRHASKIYWRFFADKLFEPEQLRRFISDYEINDATHTLAVLKINHALESVRAKLSVPSGAGMGRDTRTENFATWDAAIEARKAGIAKADHSRSHANATAFFAASQLNQGDETT